jgi:hypothetical protein
MSSINIDIIVIFATESNVKIHTDMRRLTLTFHSYPGNAKFSRVIKYRGEVAVFKKFNFHVTENTLRLDD